LSPRKRGAGIQKAYGLVRLSKYRRFLTGIIIIGVIAMKMKLVIITLILICIPAVSFAVLYSDGFITTGEYEGFVNWYSNNQPLVVDGGGAVAITMWNSSYLEVRSTSIPINDGRNPSDWHTGGITDIWLDDDSSLLYLDGSTEEITLDEYSSAVLKGGRIDAITSLQNVITPSIDLYSQVGWGWITDTSGKKIGITGLWMDGTDFNIQLINNSEYNDTWENINVIVPEPATLILMGIGGLLVRRKR
jgi:PEP-CTERM motif